MHHNQVVIVGSLTRAADQLPRYPHVDNLWWAKPCGRCLATAIRWPVPYSFRDIGTAPPFPPSGKRYRNLRGFQHRASRARFLGRAEAHVLEKGPRCFD